LLFSFCYQVLRQVLQLLALQVRSHDFKDLEILVLRHELAILQRRTRRPAITPVDRLFLTAVSRLLPRDRWHAFSSRRRRCFDGINGWSRGGGRTAADVGADRSTQCSNARGPSRP
jgi:hypothetical protein